MKKLLIIAALLLPTGAQANDPLCWTPGSSQRISELCQMASDKLERTKQNQKIIESYLKTACLELKDKNDGSEKHDELLQQCKVYFPSILGYPRP